MEKKVHGNCEHLTEDGLPSFEVLASLTNLEQIHSYHQQAKQQTTKAQSEVESATHLIDDYVSKDALENLNKIPNKIALVHQHGMQLSKTIETVCLIAESVSGKVKRLDHAKERLSSTTKRVVDIIDLNHCLEGIQTALDKKDFELVGTYIERYRKIDDSILAPETLRQLQSAEQRFSEIIATELKRAVGAKNDPEVLRFCKLHIPLGLNDRALEAYGQYYRQQIAIFGAEKMRILKRNTGKSYQDPQAEDQEVTPLNALRDLFEHAANLIHQQSAAVEQFGSGKTVAFMLALQEEVALHATSILDLFSEIHDLPGMIKAINADRFSTGSGGDQLRSSSLAPKIDPRSLTGVLDEMALMNEAAEYYDNFLREREARAIELGAVERLPQVSSIDRRIQEIINIYVSLEEYFMIQSINKSTRADDVEPDSLTSTSVDRVFFVFQKCTTRVLMTANLNAVCAVLNFIVTAINRKYKTYIEKRIQELSQSQSSSFFEQKKPELGKIPWLTLLNNLEVSAQHTSTLRQEIEIGLGSTKMAAKDVRLRSCLEDFGDCSNNLRKALASQLEPLISSVAGRLRSALQSFEGVGYVLNEDQYQEREVNDPFVQQFVTTIHPVFQPYKEALTAGNYGDLVHGVIRYIVVQLEGMLQKKRFSQWGGVQLDKEISTLQKFFVSICPKHPRDKFARLSQISILLCLEKLDDLWEYWGPNAPHITWRLTPGEVRKILLLRVDFSRDAVSKLKL